jgi:hypothetical protein
MSDNALNAVPVALPNRTFVRIVILFLLYPPVFSVLFSLLGVPLPTYLFCTMAGLMVALASTRFSWRIYPFFNLQSLTLVVLLAIIYASAVYTVSTGVWLDKVIFISYTIVVPVLVLYAAYFFRSRHSATLALLEQGMYRHAIALLWLVSLLLLLLGRPNENGRMTLPGLENAIWVSRYVGVLAVVVLCSLCRRRWSHPFQLVSVLLALVDLLYVGSRAPLVALMLVLLVHQYRRSGKSSVLLMAAAVAILLALGYILIGGYVFETGFYSLYERLNILKIFEGFATFPAGGYGVGSFGILTTGVDFLFYPHNLLAEVFFEQGFIGLAVLLALLVILARNFQFDIRGYLLLYFFLNSLGSGDIPGNNNFFILVFLCALPLAAGQQRRRPPAVPPGGMAQ